jgi:hypothetical protein
MFTLWMKDNGYWVQLPYSARGRYECNRLADIYRERNPDGHYQIAPAGYNPDLGYVGR